MFYSDERSAAEALGPRPPVVVNNQHLFRNANHPMLFPAWLAADRNLFAFATFSYNGALDRCKMWASSFRQKQALTSSHLLLRVIFRSCAETDQLCTNCADHCPDIEACQCFLRGLLIGK
jgi:hypothetical protein